MRKVSFFPRKPDGSFKPGIIKAFVMIRHASIKKLAESPAPLWASSGGLYTPYFDFPLSSLPPEDYERKQKLIISCQTFDDGQMIAVIRIFKERPTICPINLITETIDLINAYENNQDESYSCQAEG